ncbi:unnamed protein product [Calicophoron daubneyi]|uniref:CUB domain-containing protein n=1 Tax=Calicophoron daubneyi TaxID=300641 RepID=A0AAV2TZT1_CALDB
MCLSPSILFLIVRVCLSASSDEWLSRRKTSSAVLPSPDTEPDASDNLYSAVNVTLFPTRSSALGYYRFIPASFWIGIESGNHSVHPTVAENSSLSPDDDLTQLPDLSLWKDSSVLILSITKMNFSGHIPAKCPRLRICGTPSGTPLQKHALEYTGDEPMCHKGLGEISAYCYDEMPPVSHNIFPLTFGLSVSVTSLGDHPDEYNSTLKFVASSGYRLAPDTYTCPAGLFPCGVPSDISEPRSPGVQWQYRICLPNGLWCDGVINCPDDEGSDEKYCGERSEPENTAFKKGDDESHILQEHLNHFASWALRRAGYPGVARSASVQMLVVIVVGALFFLIAVVGSLILVRRKRRNFSRPQRERGFDNSRLDSEKKEPLIPSCSVPENDRSKSTDDSQPDIAVK